MIRKKIKGGVEWVAFSHAVSVEIVDWHISPSNVSERDAHCTRVFLIVAQRSPPRCVQEIFFKTGIC